MSTMQAFTTEPSYTAPSPTKFLFSFQGRISRYQYWVMYFLPYFLISVALTIADLAIGASESHARVLSGIFSIAALWPSLAIGVKRCHDRDRSGWFILVGLIPLLGAIWLFVELGCLRGTIGSNRFGPDPVLPR
jgi:uncharacterized membrane protein YhaH (DUF805 family)